MGAGKGYKEWEDLFEPSFDDDNWTRSKSFTFQASLHSSGDMEFVYKEMPLSLDKLVESLAGVEPDLELGVLTSAVSVGLSDAYHMHELSDDMVWCN